MSEEVDHVDYERLVFAAVGEALFHRGYVDGLRPKELRAVEISGRYPDTVIRVRYWHPVTKDIRELEWPLYHDIFYESDGSLGRPHSVGTIISANVEED